MTDHATTDPKILSLAGEGQTTPQIAEALGMSPRAVARARKRLGCAAEVGRPATGERTRVWVRLSDGATEKLDALATTKGVSRAQVATDLLEDLLTNPVAR